ncbi:MAG: arylsulfatase B [Flavobacteriales bacterium]|jgi:arylsulfatase B
MIFLITLVASKEHHNRSSSKMKNVKSIIFVSAILFVVAFSSCSKDDPVCVVPSSEPPNILLIIADDLGKDAINGFIEGNIKPSTPNIDGIRIDGLSFSNLWVYPTCSPTRASILTGKYGYRTGVKGAGDILPQSEVSLQAYIGEQTSNEYASAIVGKWHLSGNDLTANPESFGIDYYAGLIRGVVDDYYQWQLTEDGVGSLQNEYTTEVFTDLSIDWVNEQSMPWFLWLAYNAPHTPFHIPPSNMHNQGDLPTYVDGIDPIPYYMAAIEAMDFQIGRLLDNIPADEVENTVIIFIGDNGTPSQAAQSPYSSATVKNTLYQGGINTPMFISGRGVSRNGSDNNLVTSTDLFSTICEISGVSTNAIHDSKSFKSLFTQSSAIREFQYSELNNGVTDKWTISNGDYKLMVNASGGEEMYNLLNDSYEDNDLLNGGLTSMEQNAKVELENALDSIRN